MLNYSLLFKNIALPCKTYSSNPCRPPFEQSDYFLKPYSNPIIHFLKSFPMHLLPVVDMRIQTVPATSMPSQGPAIPRRWGLLPRHRTCLHTCGWYYVNVLLIKQPALSLHCDGSPLRLQQTSSHGSSQDCPSSGPPTSSRTFLSAPPQHGTPCPHDTPSTENLLRSLYPCYFVFTSRFLLNL